MCEELPAVTVPPNCPLRNTGRSFARPSGEVSGRGPSSFSTSNFFRRMVLPPRSGWCETTSQGEISSRNSPATPGAGISCVRPRPLFDQGALVQVQGVGRVLGRLRIVGHHHDGLAVLAVERLQQAQDLLRGLAVEIAGGLVADRSEARRVGKECVRQGRSRGWPYLQKKKIQI